MHIELALITKLLNTLLNQFRAADIARLPLTKDYYWGILANAVYNADCHPCAGLEQLEDDYQWLISPLGSEFYFHWHLKPLGGIVNYIGGAYPLPGEVNPQTDAVTYIEFDLLEQALKEILHEFHWYDIYTVPIIPEYYWHIDADDLYNLSIDAPRLSLRPLNEVYRLLVRALNDRTLVPGHLRQLGIILKYLADNGFNNYTATR